MTCTRARHSHSLNVFASVVAVFTFFAGLATPTAIASGPLFLPVVTYDSGGSGEAGDFRTVAVSDVNGDGKPDLVVTNFWSSTMGVLLGNGDGTFQPAVTFNPGVQNSAITIADVNGDGKPDLVVGVWSGGVGVLLGNGDGTFQPQVTYASGGVQVSDVAVADVNRDGKLDLIVANYGSVLGVLLGNGDGTFQSAVTYGGGLSPFAVAVADVNADGNPDLLVGDGIFGTVSVVLGNGDGSFKAAVTYTFGGMWAQSIAVADVNGDNKPDLVVAVCAASGCAHGTATVLLGNGDGTFQPAVAYDSGGAGANGVAIADVDGDGKPDLLVANWVTNSVGVLLGKGDGTFQPAVTFGSGGFFPMSVVTADLNGDGKPDLVAGNECNALFTCASGIVGVLLNNAPFDTIPPVITLSATPTKLWPPNGRLVPVTLSGTITDTGSGVNASTVEYVVEDEYGEVQPFGKITLDSTGNYSFTVLLRAGRRGNDLNGRKYTIQVSAKDDAGNRGVQWTQVTVPHDQGK